MAGTLVPKLTLGPFLTLSVKNGHKLKDWVFGIQSKSLIIETITNILLNMIRTTIPKCKLFLKSKLYKEFLFIINLLTVSRQC